MNQMLPVSDDGPVRPETNTYIKLYCKNKGVCASVGLHCYNIIRNVKREERILILFFNLGRGIASDFFLCVRPQFYLRYTCLQCVGLLYNFMWKKVPISQ